MPGSMRKSHPFTGWPLQGASAQAEQRRANAVVNVRIETSTVQGEQEGKSGGVEVTAYRTAMKVAGK